MRVTLLALSLSIASLAHADPSPPAPPAPETLPAVVRDALKRVHIEVIAPLKEREEKRSKYSRLRMPPSDRRVQATSTSTLTDALGRAFVPFVIERKNTMGLAEGVGYREDKTGCIYVDGDIFVAFGAGDSKEFRPASVLLGKPSTETPTAGVCTAATPKS